MRNYLRTPLPDSAHNSSLKEIFRLFPAEISETTRGERPFPQDRESPGVRVLSEIAQNVKLQPTYIERILYANRMWFIQRDVVISKVKQKMSSLTYDWFALNFTQSACRDSMNHFSEAITLRAISR